MSIPDLNPGLIYGFGYGKFMSQNLRDPL